jgi:hypothetical protein
MKHLKKFNEELGVKMTFDEVMNTEWEKEYPYDGGGPGARIEDKGVIFSYHSVWDEFMPLSHSLSKADNIKLYNVLFYSKEMYNFLKESNDPKAKEILNKINSDKNYTEGY